MKAKYICVPLHLISQSYLVKLGKRRILNSNYSLVYEIVTDDYSIRASPIYSTAATFICNSEEQFQSLIAEHKLMGIL